MQNLRDSLHFLNLHIEYFEKKAYNCQFGKIEIMANIYGLRERIKERKK